MSVEGDNVSCRCGCQLKVTMSVVGADVSCRCGCQL